MTWQDRLRDEHVRLARDSGRQEYLADTIRKADAANLVVAACTADSYGLRALASQLRDTALQITEGEITTGK